MQTVYLAMPSILRLLFGRWEWVRVRVNDRKTSVLANALFTNTAEFIKMHKASCKRIDVTHTAEQIETWRRKADSSDYLLGNELSDVTMGLAVPLATRMLQRLFDYSFPISDYHYNSKARKTG